MEKKIIQKIAAIIVVTLVIASILAVFIIIQEQKETPSVESKTIYVDDDGGKDYASIQEAIDAASDGDTVYVYNGTYHNNVTGYTIETFRMRAIVVNKSINLLGESKDSTFIDGNNLSGGSIIKITADRVNISGFTIQNSRNVLDFVDMPLDLGCGIIINSNYTNISNNIITGNTIGMNIGGSYNIITSNTIIDNGDGIILYGSNNEIKSNMIKNHSKNLMVWGISSNNGISIYGGNENMIYMNSIINNSGTGIVLHGESTNHTLYCNNFVNNTLNAKDLFTNNWNNDGLGNYWSDYEEKYPNAGQLNNDLVGLIWDTPYNISGGNNQDRYPIVYPVDI